MGMSSAEFWDITPREFYAKLEGWQEQKRADTETLVYYDRLFTSYLLNVHLEKQHRIKPVDLLRFEWEEKEAPKKVPTKEEIKRTIEDMRRRVEKNPKKRPLTPEEMAKIGF